MTVQDLLSLVSRYERHALILAVGVPLLALGMNGMLGRGGGNRAPWNWVNSLLVYAVCIPGMAAAVLTLYQLLFRHRDLLSLPIAVYYAPLLCMLATLAAVGRSADFDALPGFGRLAGLMTMIGASFGVLLAVDRMRVLIIFGGSVATLAAIFAFVFALIKWGAHALARRADDPARPAPAFPGRDAGRGGDFFG